MRPKASPPLTATGQGSRRCTSRKYEERGKAYAPKTLEQTQEVRLRQARRHRKTLRAVQGKSKAILERPQESRRCSSGSTLGGIRWWEDEEEIRAFPHYVGAGCTRLAQQGLQNL